jgi:D-3-phosphoglycerate dehydrogenase / 2-oxoglutarate reductase
MTTQTSLDRAKIKILLLEGVHQSAIDNFRSAGYTNLDIRSTALNDDELRDALRDVHMLGIRSRTQVTPEVIAEARRLIAIGCFCIGTNQVALKPAMLAGVPVFNAPYSNTRSVAELVLAEAILLLRGVPARHQKLLQGAWEKSARNSFEIRGKTLGVIGYGNIGAQLGVMAEAMGMRVLFYDVVKKLNLGNARQVELNELLAESDVVSLHVPSTPLTANMIGADELARMKDTAILINASRGNVVQLDALAAALQEQRLLGAALDVYPTEPKSNDEVFINPLSHCDNVILTPHIGGSTVEAQENIGIEVSEKLIHYSDNGSTLSAVNFPEVSLPSQGGKHRLLHIHRNVPGVLSRINALFYDNNINIAAQYLQTNADIGYVVIDLDAEHSQTALEGLRDVEGTIRTRVLF